MKGTFKPILILLFIFFLLPGCGGGGGGDNGDDGGTAVPALSISGNTLTFSGTEGETDPADKAFTISNTGDSGSTLNWTAGIVTSDGGNWLGVSPASGALASAAQASLTVSVDISALEAGSYSGTVTVTDPEASSSPRTVSVSLQVVEPAAPPTISVNYTGYSLPIANNPMAFMAEEGASPTPQTLTINNAGELTLSWAAEPDQTWLSLGSTQGSLAGSSATNIQVFVNADSLDPGDYTGTITITDEAAANSPFAVPVTLTVTQQAAAASGDVFIAGSADVTQFSSPVASVGKAALGADPANALANVKILITIIHPDGTTSEKVVFTNAQGNFSARVTVTEGDRVTVNMEKDGYTRFSKAIRVVPGERYTVIGSLAKAEVIVAKRGETYFKASGQTAPAFKFGLVRHRDGSRSTFGSEDKLQVAKAAGGTADLEVTIPAAKVGPDVETLTAQLAGFDPNNAAERKMFPGEFVGAGGMIASAATDEGEYQLESIVFLQADIRQDNGQKLQVVTATGPAAAADEEPITIVKWVPTEGCEAMKKYQDRDPAKEGIQAPIYTYNPNTGKWGYLGEGTLLEYDSNLGRYQTATVTDPTNLSCGSVDYYIEIVVDTEWYTFWNLDYPLLFDQPQEVCVRGEVVDGAGNPLPGVYLWANGPTFFDGYSDQNGELGIDVVVSDLSELDLYDLFAYNQMTGQDVSFSLGELNGECYTPVVTLKDPFQCRVEGAVVDSGQPLRNEWVYAYGTGGRFSGWQTTDDLGQYAFKTTCEKDIVVEVRGQTKMVNVNGMQGDDEESDVNNLVMVQDISVVNNPPEIWLELWPRTARAGDDVSLDAWAWDYEGDEPLTYQWEVVYPDSTSQNLGAAYSATWSTTGLSDGNYTVRVTVEDSLFNSDSREDTVTINTTNRNPVIWDAGYRMTPDANCNPTVTLWADAYDYDGDYPLTFTWDLPDGGQFTGEEADWSTPETGAVTLTVADSLGGTATTSFTIDIVNQPPEIWWAYADPNPALIGQTVYLDAYAWDEEDGDVGSYQWTVTDPSGGSVEIDPIGWFWDPAISGDYQVRLDVSDACGETATSTFRVGVAEEAGDTTVIIQ